MESKSVLLKYNSDNVTIDNFKDANNWDILKDILLYHPSQITRHEASFVIGELKIIEFIPLLMKVVLYDSSIVARHEAIEALGKMKSAYSKEIIDFLEEVVYNKNSNDIMSHSDIQVTAKEAIEKLTHKKRILQKLKVFEASRTLCS